MGNIGFVRPHCVAQAHERATASVDIKRGVRLKIGALIGNDARCSWALLVLVFKHTTRNDLVHMLELQTVH